MIRKFRNVSVSYKRKLIIILIAVAISLVATLVKVNAADYKVLKQEGRSCTVYAVETYIDIVGNPSKVGAKKAIKALGVHLNRS